MYIYTKPILLKYFIISNRIEGIDDENEAIAQEEFFWDTLQMCDEQVMYLLHSKMNYLNDYCKAGELRDYDVFVGGRKCLAPKHIELKLEELFKEMPTTSEAIKDWHVRFEKIHPFGDWNGRTGRFLMLRHIWNANIEIPEILRDDTNFEANRQEYYRWFS